MGNRAVITTKSKTIGIYLHWNGGPDSVLAFLRACKDLGYRSPESDESYAMARLTCVIGDWLGRDDGLSVGIGALSDLDCDNGDNGVYVIGGDWSIKSRTYKGPTTYTALGDKDREKCDGIYAEIMALFGKNAAA